MQHELHYRNQLDGQGKARREAARRHNYEYKINLGPVEIPLAAMAAGECSGDWPSSDSSCNWREMV